MKLFFIFLLFFLVACSGPHKAMQSQASSSLVVSGKLWSSLFQQRAAEYKAMCLQSFALARLRVDEWVQKKPARPMAVITDIDETFLDNSPYAVHQALQGRDYEQDSWYEWTSKASADTLLGALDFFKYAASQQVEVFYITNRDEKERDATLKNLQRFGFPFADNQHLVLRQDASTKEFRRQQVAGSHEIILLLGDNLADFSSLFDKKSEPERDTNFRLLAPEFGKKFILLPNTSYGGWEEAVYQNSRNWSSAQKDSLIRTVLKGY